MPQLRPENMDLSRLATNGLSDLYVKSLAGFNRWSPPSGFHVYRRLGDVTEELTPLLSNLMLNDNEIRSQAEKTMDNRLAQSPGTYLVALAQFAVSAESDVMCSFTLVLLRRFMLRPGSDQPRPTTNAKGRPQPLSDQITPAISGAIEDLLLHSFMHESSPSVRSASVETITALVNNMRRKGLSKPALFDPHLQSTLDFLGPLILLNTDEGLTPTESKLAFTFPPPPKIPKSPKDDADELDEEKEAMMIEFMITLSEAKLGIFMSVHEWTAAVVRGCLEGSLWHLKKNPVLSHTFEHLPGMLASYDWRLRRAGLAVIAQVVVPWSFTIMQDDLSKLVKMVVPLFKDSHPRVRYAACQAVGQLYSDVHHSAQKKFGRELFVVLISTLEAPEKRVRSQAAAALIDLCDGIQQAEIMPYLDPIVERLLDPLNPTEDNAKQTNTYVQEQAIPALAVVAKKSPGVFAKHYSSVMPLLLNILRNPNRSDSGKLIAKTMECTGLITAAVGLDVFRPDAATLAELLVQIQNNVSEPASWHLLSLFTKKGGIPSLKMDAKREAFQSLAVYCSTMQAGFARYISQSLELTLSALRLNPFYGIRDVCTPLVPALLSCAKASNTHTTEMISSSLFELINCIGFETESTYLTSHLEFFTTSLKVVGGPVLPPELCNGLVESMKRQLDRIADRRKNVRPQPDMAFGFDFGAMDDEMEAFALKRMEKLLYYLDLNHLLLASVSSMMVMGPNQSGHDLTYKIQSALARLMGL
ncbi:hypothetical protein PILCRDRAFT_89265 [Piloderma croceum F 1598]|uniref:TOG domain-containing protein n=1 Tax=Piloderma croceum (strain F 1598) TaxID=765440 RepID=A0A0C3FME4_PILCF|nr:hypothetical protein PILCRDRAFT_89265 [Piloderma croceum F 1598]